MYDTPFKTGASRAGSPNMAASQNSPQAEAKIM